MSIDFTQRTLSILGSTGSIGTQALEIAEHLKIRVVSIAAFGNIEMLEQQVRRFRPKTVAVYDEKAAGDLKIKIADLDIPVLAGEQGVCAAAAEPADSVITSIVGVAGLLPTMAAIDAGNNIALANKETLVAAGELVMRRAGEKNITILPVDSEHSAIFQCINGGRREDLKRILLTASGGPFFGKSAKELENARPQDALKHPNWSMGAKITIDSATLMNKGLEEIEAVHLFGVGADDIEVLIHRESIVHSMVEFADGSVIAQMGVPDMRLPIQYALTYPERLPSIVESVDFFKVGALTFAPPDKKTFRCLAVCERALKLGGLYPAAVNAANEVAVAAFLNGKIPFGKIGDAVEKALEYDVASDYSCLDDVFSLDREVRAKTKEITG